MWSSPQHLFVYTIFTVECTYLYAYKYMSNSITLSCYFIFQNTKNANGQVKYLVYCMENAILNLPHGQDQMVWLIDFAGFNLGNLSLQVTKMTADVLQGHYPERLGVAILYNAPKFFEPFWKVCLYNL